MGRKAMEGRSGVAACGREEGDGGRGAALWPADWGGVGGDGKEMGQALCLRCGLMPHK